MQIIIPNQIGSKPRIGARGASIGTMIKKIPIHKVMENSIRKIKKVYG